MHEFWSFILILIIIAFVFQMVIEIVRMPHSIYYCIVSIYTQKDKTWFKWLIKNQYYIWLHPMVVFCAYSAVIKASQLDLGVSTIRPLWDVITWVIILGCAIVHNVFIYNRIRKCNEQSHKN